MFRREFKLSWRADCGLPAEGEKVESDGRNRKKIAVLSWRTRSLPPFLAGGFPVAGKRIISSW